MHLVILFFLELFILFLLSREVTRLLSYFFYRITHSTKLTVYLMSFLFFPGTVIHELAHYLTAIMLFVPAHKIEFFPKLEGDSLKLGSVSIAKTDFFRRLLIGTAPFFIGTILLLSLLFLGAHNELFNNNLYIILLGYAVFEIGNTMFSSKKDMEGALEVLFAVAIIITALYFAQLPLPTINPDIPFAHPLVKQIFEKGSIFLLVPIGIDLILIFLLRLFKQ